MQVHAPFRCPGCGVATAGRVHGYCTWDCYDSHDYMHETSERIKEPEPA